LERLPLPMIRHWPFPTPNGLMPLSFFFIGTSVHVMTDESRYVMVWNSVCRQISGKGSYFVG